MCTTHDSAVRNGDVANKGLHKNFVASDILYSNNQPITFHSLDSFIVRDQSGTAPKLTVWETFKSLTFDTMPPRIQTKSETSADKTACKFVASISSAHFQM